MAVQIVLYLAVDGDSVTPGVVVDSGRNWMSDSRPTAEAGDLATARKATEIANRVLDFAEGIKR